jgi:stage V sporulation protein R
VKQKILAGLTNFGQPVIQVIDGNFENRGELLLEHKHDGGDLRLDYARDTLENIFHLWNRPVHIKTVVEGKEKLLGYDGESHLERTTDA